MAMDSGSKKRKRKLSESSSRLKQQQLTAASPDHLPKTSLKQLEQDITSSRRHYNNLNALLRLLPSQSHEERQEAKICLCRAFCKLMSIEQFTLTVSENNDDEATIKRWLKEKLNRYKEHLRSEISGQVLEDSRNAIDLAMQLYKSEAQSLSDNGLSTSNAENLQFVLEAVLSSQTSNGAFEYFTDDFVCTYKDLLVLTVERVRNLVSNNSFSSSLDSFTSILTKITKIVLRENIPLLNNFLSAHDDTQSSKTPEKSLRKDLSNAWIHLLRMDMTKQQRKTFLGLMSNQIVPSVDKAERLLDFLTDSFNIGGSTSLLSLSGLFDLMQNRNVDYPQFYTQLYSLLQPGLLHSKHRSRFLRLLNTFLSSTHLSGALVASFIKRIARNCLSLPPAAIASLVPLIYNLLYKHRECTFMIHRARAKSLANGAMVSAEPQRTENDPFNNDEPDPHLTNAIESSLWEIETLRNHYNPAVSTIANVISEQFTKPSYDLEHFLDHSYDSVLQSELSKPLKKSPATVFEIPKHIFDADEHATKAAPMNLLWDFDAKR